MNNSYVHRIDPITEHIAGVHLRPAVLWARRLALVALATLALTIISDWTGGLAHRCGKRLPGLTQVAGGEQQGGQAGLDGNRRPQSVMRKWQRDLSPLDSRSDSPMSPDECAPPNFMAPFGVTI